MARLVVIRYAGDHFSLEKSNVCGGHGAQAYKGVWGRAAGGGQEELKGAWLLDAKEVPNKFTPQFIPLDLYKI